MRRKTPVILLMIALLSPAAQGGGIQSHESIHQAARAFLESQVTAFRGSPVEIVDGRLDPRLRLAQCDRPLETFMSPGGRKLGNTTVGVRCNGSKRWTLYVPMTINVHADVGVPSESLPKGTVLDRNNVKTARFNLARLPQGYYRDPAEVEGMELKRNVAAGQPLTPAMLKTQRMIERGQRVTLVAGSGGLEVRVAGQALSHGAKGERIRVRNLSSKRTVEGLVVGAGLVRVGR